MAPYLLLQAPVQAVIQDRATGVPICNLSNNDSEVKWERRLGRPSRASARLGTRGIEDCAECLGRIGTWGHELAIYRGESLVWVGPVVDIDDDTVDFTFRITAADRMTWVEERVTLRDIDHSIRGVDSSTYFAELFAEADGADAIGLTLQINRNTGDWIDKFLAAGSSVQAEMRRVSNDIFDWTVVGDRLFAGVDAYDLPPFQTLTNSAWEDSGVSVIQDGKMIVTHVTVLGDNGIEATHPRGEIIPHPFFGLHHISITDRDITTLQAARTRAQALWEDSSSGSAPVYLTSSRSLGSRCPATWGDLIPGRFFVFLIEGTASTYELNQRLTQVKGEATDGQETRVVVSFQPPTEVSA